MMWTKRAGIFVRSHDDLHPECTDIVYVITYSNGQNYIGKKAVRAKRKYPPLKGKVRIRRLWKNLPFMDYEGSHDVEGLTPVRKFIKYECSSRKTATFLEIECLIKFDALFDSSYINENISGKFFRNSKDGLL